MAATSLSAIFAALFCEKRRKALEKEEKAKLRKIRIRRSFKKGKTLRMVPTLQY